MLNLCPTDEYLWIVSTGGASYSDIRFDDWQAYGPGEGYPGQTVFDVEADVDYAYAATDSGLARFDNYVLEWETLDAPPDLTFGPASDVAEDDERVWFGLGHGVAEFRKGPESFHFYSALGQITEPKVLALRQSPRYLWAITTQGLARFDKELETWTSYLAGTDLPDARVY